MAIEQHILEEVGRQLEYYVDAYRQVHTLVMRIASLVEQIEQLNTERAEAERLRDDAATLVNELIKDIPEEDEGEVKRLTEEKLAPLVGIMVL